MKITLTFLLIIYAISSVFAQDKITRTNGIIVHCDIESVDSINVKYIVQQSYGEDVIFMKLHEVDQIILDGKTYEKHELGALIGYSRQQISKRDLNGFYMGIQVGTMKVTDPIINCGVMEFNYLTSNSVFTLHGRYYRQKAWVSGMNILNEYYSRYGSRPYMETNLLYGVYTGNRFTRLQIQFGPGLFLDPSSNKTIDAFTFSIRAGMRFLFPKSSSMGLDLYLNTLDNQAHIGANLAFDLGNTRYGN